MAELFISYSRTDRPRAKRLVDALTQAGFEVFWDQATPPGVAWADFIERHLDDARALLALWSKTSVQSRWVRTEAYEALQQQKLLPVLLDKVRQPLAFREIQAFDLTEWDEGNDEQLQVLIRHLHDQMGPSSPAGSATARPLPEPARPEGRSTFMERGFALVRARRVSAGALVVAGLLLIGAGYAWLRHPSGGVGPELALPTEPTGAGDAGRLQQTGASPVEPTQTRASEASGRLQPPKGDAAPTNGEAISPDKPKARPKPLDPRCRDIVQRIAMGESVSAEEQDLLKKGCQ
jgi:hypothetical protein